MFARNEYQLIDFGEGRRLEAFGSLVLERPCPAAEAIAKRDPAIWQSAHARFVRADEKLGEWISAGELPERWTIAHRPFVFELKRTEFGHLGVFPEQAANWDWIATQFSADVLEGNRTGSPHPRPLSQRERGGFRVLNLFAYTGGGTLAAAAAGAEVTHVDAARNVVAWARRNAELSGLADAPVRWIVEDAMKFVRREVNRGSRYDAVILDPPSYGHGRRGEVWRLSRHLRRLLEMCGELLRGEAGRRFVLLTCHTPGYTPEKLRRLLAETLGEGDERSGETMMLRAATGQELPSGVVMRWVANG